MGLITAARKAWSHYFGRALNVQVRGTSLYSVYFAQNIFLIVSFHLPFFPCIFFSFLSFLPPPLPLLLFTKKIIDGKLSQPLTMIIGEFEISFIEGDGIMTTIDYLDIVAMNETSGTLKIWTSDREHLLQVPPGITLSFITEHMSKMKEVSDVVLSVSDHSLVDQDPEILTFEKDEPIIVQRSEFIFLFYVIGSTFFFFFFFKLKSVHRNPANQTLSGGRVIVCQNLRKWLPFQPNMCSRSVVPFAVWNPQFFRFRSYLLSFFFLFFFLKKSENPKWKVI